VVQNGESYPGNRGRQAKTKDIEQEMKGKTRNFEQEMKDVE